LTILSKKSNLGKGKYTPAQEMVGKTTILSRIISRNGRE